MAKAFWKGAISFGMVAIPVRVSVATEHKMPGFHYLHKKCLTRPKQVWYCPTDDEYIELRDMDKGVEYTKGQYVVLDETDFKRVAIKSTHTIDVFGFVAPQEYKDEYGLALDKLIEAKLQGKQIQAPKVAKAKTVDLMTALRQSIGEAEKKAQSGKQPVGAR